MDEGRSAAVAESGVRRRTRRGLVAALAVAALMAASPTDVGHAAAPPTTPAPAAPAAAPSTPPPASAVPAAAAPVDLVAATDWLAGIYASPCDGTAVELLAGGAATGAGYVSLNGVTTLDGAAGQALVFLNCRDAAGSLTNSVAQLITVDAAGTRTTYAQQSIPAGSTVISVSPTEIVLESAAGTPPDGGCCAPYVRRQRVAVTATTFTVTDGALIPAFHRSLTSASNAGDGVALVTRTVPRTAPCFQWPNTPQQLTNPDPAAGIRTAPAELITLRLALIHLTGMWIEPAPYFAPDLDAAARSFQSTRGLPVDGVVGRQTTDAIRAELGCPPTQSFSQVDPTVLGPRIFGSPAELGAAAARYGREGMSGSPGLDDLLFWSRWDGANSLFLGCSLRETPANGITCSWSGATPLQLVGLTTDTQPTTIGSFAILYARTAAGPAPG